MAYQNSYDTVFCIPVGPKCVLKGLFCCWSENSRLQSEALKQNQEANKETPKEPLKVEFTCPY